MYCLLYAWPAFAFLQPVALVESYHFGGESMMAHGGWVYRSPSTYGWYNFASGCAFVAATVFFWHTRRRPLVSTLLSGYALFFTPRLVTALLNRVMMP